MKSFYIMALTITCTVFCAGGIYAREEVKVLPATLMPSCAPWDGAAVEISMDLPDGQTFKASVYGQGYERFRDGDEFTLDGQGSNSDATGRGRVCKGDACNDVEATIHIPKRNDDGTYGQGTISIPMDGKHTVFSREIVYTVAPVMDMSHGPAICG